MRAAAISDIGLVRAKNEDAFWCDEERGIFIVADGIGGGQAGEVASALAVEVISAELTLAVDRGLKEIELTDAMFDAFREASEEVYTRAQESEEHLGMACSAIAGILKEGYCMIAHTGDARAYLFSQDTLYQITVDDTPVAALVKRGFLLPEKARVHQLKNILTKSIGTQKTVDANLSRFPVKAREQLMLCTDGLWAMLTQMQICEILRKRKNPEETCRELVQAARTGGGPDNITVIIVELDDVPVGKKAKPSTTEVRHSIVRTDS